MIEGINSAEAVIKHFRNTLLYIQSRKDGLGLHDPSLVGAGGGGSNGNEGVKNLFEDVDVAGPLLKLSG